MFRLIKKIVILILITCSSGNIIQNVAGNFMFILKNKPDCFLLKNEECKVRKVIIDNDYMTYPYKINVNKVNKCIGNSNDKNNPYFKICLPDIVKNVSIKVFDLLLQKNVLKILVFIKIVNVRVY